MTTTELVTERSKYLPETWNAAAKPCDYCHTSAALLFCRTDSAFMCMACDAKVHSARDKHARVWLCEVCEHSPAAVTCKADAASLCVTCDRDIHAANPLARRHERIAVVPFFDTAESVLMKSGGVSAEFPSPDAKLEGYVSEDPWIITDPSFGGSKYPVENPELKSMNFFFTDSDQFLDFENFGNGIAAQQTYNDSVVPVQTSTKSTMFSQDYSSENRFEIDFTKSNISSYNNNNSTTYTTTPSLSVSSSSIDVGVVPDGGAFSDISYNFVKDPVTHLNLDLNQVSQIGMDREARVLRYREKRKNRKFEKTVRYASRKAYAETRPRVKGRFAKRIDNKTESENVNRMFGSVPVNFIRDDRCGVVPSF